MISDAKRWDQVILIAKDGSGSARQHELLANKGVFVGTSVNCGFQLSGNDLSSIHCRIELEGGKLWIQDWMSANGTRLNGELISARLEVQWNDVIEIGQHQITVSTMPSERFSGADRDDAAECSNPADDPAVEHDITEPNAVSTETSPLSDQSSDDHVAPRFDDPADLDPDPSEPSDFEIDIDFDFEDKETFDHETVALLRAEIEDLQAALAMRDAEEHNGRCECHVTPTSEAAGTSGSDEVLQRMQDLVDEANRSDERVAILEELLHAADDANRSERDERHQLEAWVGDIEKRLGQREEEHVAEIEALRARLDVANCQQQRLHKQLHSAAFKGSAPKQYEETLENLQKVNQQLQNNLAESQQQRLTLEQRLERLSTEQDRALREERANIAKEQAKLARLRFELSSKMAEVEVLPKAESKTDRETAHRIQTLRDHLREIHEQEKTEEREASLTSRLAKLWKRVEY